MNNQNPVAAVLERFVEHSPQSFEHHLGDRQGRVPVLLAGHGIIDWRIRRSSIKHEFFSVASDGITEWIGPPLVYTEDVEPRPAQMLQPLWLIWCLFGAESASTIDQQEHSGITVRVECDLDKALRVTQMNLPIPPEGPDQALDLLLNGDRLEEVRAEAYVGRATMTFSSEDIDEDQLDWRRIGGRRPTAETALETASPHPPSIEGAEDALARSTRDIDDQLVAAVTKAMIAEGITQNAEPDARQSEAALKRVVTEDAPLLDELIRRYKEVIPPSGEDDQVTALGYLVVWLSEHIDRIHDLTEISGT